MGHKKSADGESSMKFFPSRGQAVVEFAFVLPIIFLFIVAVIEMALIGIKSVNETYETYQRMRKSYENALPENLSNEVLRGGDTPSPYCNDGERYNLCGFPE